MPPTLSSSHSFDRDSLSVSSPPSSVSSSSSVLTAVPQDRRGTVGGNSTTFSRSPLVDHANSGLTQSGDEQEEEDEREERFAAEREDLDGDDDDDVASIAGSTMSIADHDKEELGPTHYIPLVFVALPLVGGAFLGRADSWSDGLVLLLVGWWMWFLIKTPWELYHSSLHHSLLSSPHKLPTLQHQSAHLHLNQTHNIFLLLTLLAPLFGSLLLHLTRSYALSPASSERYINSFNIRLFLFASSIKPVLNLKRVLENRTAVLKKALGRPKEEEWDLLKRQMVELEDEIKGLKEVKAERKELGELREELGGKAIGDLGKAVRRQERRGELTRLSLSERVDILSTQVTTLEAELEYARTSAQHSHYSLSWLLSLLHLYGSNSTSSKSSSSSITSHNIPSHANRHLTTIISEGKSSPSNGYPQQKPQQRRPKQPFRLQSSNSIHQQKQQVLSPPSSSLSSGDEREDRGGREDEIVGRFPSFKKNRPNGTRNLEQKERDESRGSVGWVIGTIWRDVVMLSVSVGWGVAMVPIKVGLWALRRVV